MDTPHLVYILVGLTASLLQAGYAVYLLARDRRVSPAVWVLLISALWSATAAAECALPALAAKVVADRLQYVGFAFLPAAWVIFCLRYSRREERLPPWVLPALGLLPTLLLALALTNPWHGAVWRTPEVQVGQMLVKDRAWGFWLLITHAYLLVGAGVVVLGRLIRSGPRFHARQARALTLAALAPAAAGIADILSPPALGGLDLTPIAIAVTVLVVIWGFARMQYRERVPVAHRTIVETMADPVVIADNARNVLYLNPAAEARLELRLANERGRPLGASSPEILDALETALTDPEAGAELERWPRTYHIQVSTLTDLRKAPVGVVAVLRDVTALRSAEARLRELAAQEELSRSAREKEILFRELHHRVRNHLQIISSLLSLQGSRVTDPEARAILDGAYTRIGAMAAMHELLDAGRGEASLGVYLERVARATTDVYGRPGVALSFELEDVHLADHRATLAGLILNELVTNALKHAYPEGGAGEIRVRLAASATEVSLSVLDDGVGLPEDTDPARATTLGFLIVSVLARQLGGAVRVRRDRGTEAGVVFPVP